MSSAEAHAESDDEGAAGVAFGKRPIDLVDIARILGESAHIERLGPHAPIRAWRDDLTLIRESLAYAMEVLAADVEVLSPSGTQAPVEPSSVVPGPPNAGAQDPSQEQWPPINLDDFDVFIDEELFARTDQLLAAHREMARVDLSSPTATAAVLVLVKEHLAILTERHAAVDARLQQIRAVIIRHYRRAAMPARDKPA